MPLPLTLHPGSRCEAVTQIRVEAVRQNPSGLMLKYLVTGSIGDLRLPPVTTPACADELWWHTCFEAFVRAPTGPAYYELNFAPSTQWAAYWFSGYRSGMTVASEMSAPRLEVQSDGDVYELKALLELDSLTRLPADTPWRLGLSAVIEEVSGRISYWALAHPPGKPDFHHSDGFALELSPANSK